MRRENVFLMTIFKI